MEASVGPLAHPLRGFMRKRTHCSPASIVRIADKLLLRRIDLEKRSQGQLGFSEVNVVRCNVDTRSLERIADISLDLERLELSADFGDRGQPVEAI